MTSGIYCIENTVNNKKYVGKSIDIHKRFIKHKSQLRNNNHENPYMQRQWNKYGEDSFKFYILEQCEKDEMDKKEAEWIAKLNTYLDKKVGYNLTPGGEESYKFSKEQLEKYPKLSKRKPFSDKTKSRMSEYHKSLFEKDPSRFDGEKNPFYGKKHSEESKKKNSEAHIGKVLSEESKKKMSESIKKTLAKKKLQKLKEKEIEML